MITPESIESEDAPPKALGSCVIYEAENIEVVRKMVESDIYYTSGVVNTHRDLSYLKRLTLYLNSGTEKSLSSYRSLRPLHSRDDVESSLYLILSTGRASH